MTITNRLLLLLAATTLLFSSCKHENEAVIEEAALLSAHTETNLKGSTLIDQHQLSYEVALVDNYYQLQATVNQKTLDMQVSYETGVITLDGHNQTLAATEMLALNQAAVQLGEYLAEQNVDEEGNLYFTEAENTLVRLMDFLSQAPADHVYTQRVHRPSGEVSTRGLGNNGVRCIKKGRTYTLKYDGSRGVTTTRKRANYNGGGSYGCMGRCGGGCGSWWVPKSWTLDCFEHDECSLRYGASGGASDRNCGDEWWNASDDWTFGVARGCFG